MWREIGGAHGRRRRKSDGGAAAADRPERAWKREAAASRTSPRCPPHRPTHTHTHAHALTRQTLTAVNLGALPTAAAALAACLRSDPGSEPRPPTLPYTTLADGAPYLAPRRLDLRGKR